jgi:hypothetical protein
MIGRSIQNNGRRASVEISDGEEPGNEGVCAGGKATLQDTEQGPATKTEASEYLKGLIQAWTGLGAVIGRVVTHVASLPPSKGYEPYFVARDVDPILARGMAMLAVRHGKLRLNRNVGHRL